MSSAESSIVEMIRNREGEFSKGVIAGPFQKVCDRLQAVMAPGVKVPPAALLHALQEAQWVDLGLVHARPEYATKRHIFAAPEMAERYSRSDLRRMVDQAAAPKVVDLKVVG